MYSWVIYRSTKLPLLRDHFDLDQISGSGRPPYGAPPILTQVDISRRQSLTSTYRKMALSMLRADEADAAEVSTAAGGAVRAGGVEVTPLAAADGVMWEADAAPSLSQASALSLSLQKV